MLRRFAGAWVAATLRMSAPNDGSWPTSSAPERHVRDAGRLELRATGESGVHVQLRMPGRFSLELDTAESARRWHAGRRADPASVSVVIGFALPSREAVDERHAALDGRWSRRASAALRRLLGRPLT